MSLMLGKFAFFGYERFIQAFSTISKRDAISGFYMGEINVKYHIVNSTLGMKYVHNETLKRVNKNQIL